VIRDISFDKKALLEKRREEKRKEEKRKRGKIIHSPENTIF